MHVGATADLFLRSTEVQDLDRLRLSAMTWSHGFFKERQAIAVDAKGYNRWSCFLTPSGLNVSSTCSRLEYVFVPANPTTNLHTCNMCVSLFLGINSKKILTLAGRMPICLNMQICTGAPAQETQHLYIITFQSFRFLRCMNTH